MRAITKEHLEAYKTGCLKKLFHVIKEDPELSFEIRKDNTVMVYYRKGKILTVNYTDANNYTITGLHKNYYKNCEIQMDFFHAGKCAYTLNHTNILRDEYFKNAKKFIHSYKVGLEFSIQQNIALGNRNFNKRFLVVDMEWQFSQSAIDENDRVGKTRVDLIIVDTKANNSGENDIYLAELKVGTGATDGKSGVIDHIHKTKMLVDNEKACSDLKNDIENIITQKSQLGLFAGEEKKFNLAAKPKMMIILGYRGENELEYLEKQVEIARTEAKNIGLSELFIIKKDLRIEL